MKPDEFCESISDFGGMRRTELLDGCTEYLIGDLVSEEVRSFALEINLKPGDSGSVGRLLAMEFLYDLVQEDGLEPIMEKRDVEISFVNNPEDMQVG